MLEKLKVLYSRLKTELIKTKDEIQTGFYLALTKAYTVYQVVAKVAKFIHRAWTLFKKIVWFVLKPVLIVASFVMILDFVIGDLPRSSLYHKDGLVPYGQAPSNPNPKLDPVISIFHTDETGKEKFHCTAFVIDANYAITAGHCVYDDKGPNVLGKLRAKVTGSSQKVAVEAVAYEMRTDVGLIRGNFNNFTVFPIDFQSFNWLTEKKVYLACGHPGGQNATSCSPFMVRYQDLFLLTGPGAVIPGMSGGPVFDPKTHVVIGVVSRATMKQEGSVQMAPMVGALGNLGIDPTK